MRRTFSGWFAAVFIFALTPVPAMSDAPTFRISDVTPVGSWAEREQRTVNHKKKETLSVMRQTLVGKEDRDGETHYWVETEATNYKITKKGEKKKQGQTTIIKALIAGSMFDADPANISNNLTGFGKEIIFQTGNEQPMRMKEGGTMADFMMKALGVKVDYTFTSAGNDTVEIPAGTFNAQKFTGTGSVDTRILIQKISIRSESEFWMTPELPFGFAHMISKETVNKKPQSSEASVTSYGMSGGTSKITQEPVDFMGGGDQKGIKFKDLIPGG